jgi:hypothetical protein
VVIRIARHQNTELQSSDLKGITFLQHALVGLLAVDSNTVTTAIPNLKTAFSDANLAMDSGNRFVIDPDIGPTSRSSDDDRRTIDDNALTVVLSDENGDGGHYASPQITGDACENGSVHHQ